MRLSEHEIKIIKDKVDTIFGKAVIYLFGSRVDNTKKGGDIDLYIISEIKNNIFRKKLRLKTILEDILFKPIDIIIATDEKRLIEQEAIQGVKLI